MPKKARSRDVAQDIDDDDVMQEWKEAVQESNLPTVVGINVYRPGDETPKGKIGTITVLHPDSNQEAISVYCNRHQCKIVKRVAHSASIVQMRQWFRAGLSIPYGKDHQLQHRSQWETICS